MESRWATTQAASRPAAQGQPPPTGALSGTSAQDSPLAACSDLPVPVPSAQWPSGPAVAARCPFSSCDDLIKNHAESELRDSGGCGSQTPKSPNFAESRPAPIQVQMAGKMAGIFPFQVPIGPGSGKYSGFDFAPIPICRDFGPEMGESRFGRDQTRTRKFIPNSRSPIPDLAGTPSRKRGTLRGDPRFPTRPGFRESGNPPFPDWPQIGKSGIPCGCEYSRHDPGLRPGWMLPSSWVLQM